MIPRLPKDIQPAEVRRLRELGDEFWGPVVAAILHRHGLDGATVTRFVDGEQAVFSVGDALVLKIVPPFAADVLQREIALLRSLPRGHHVPVAEIESAGEMDGWHYLVSSRVPGTPLHRVWSSLSRPRQEKLAGDFGAMLRTLHDLPPEPRGDFGPPDWNQWVREAIAQWPWRWGVERLPDALRADGPRFLSAIGPGAIELAAPAWRRLHGDLAPENALVELQDGGWRMSGMIDFGNAMLGDPLFDYTAPTVLLQPGDAGIVRCFLTGAGVPETTSLSGIRRRMMAYTLIHPMGDLRNCLELIPGGVACATWDEVAAKFWPETVSNTPAILSANS